MANRHYVGSTGAAQLLGIDRSTLSRWVKSGKITPADRLTEKPASAQLFSREDVERLAAVRSVAVCGRCGVPLTAARIAKIARASANNGPAVTKPSTNSPNAA